jgi:hypothetical protein
LRRLPPRHEPFAVGCLEDQILKAVEACLHGRGALVRRRIEQNALAQKECRKNADIQSEERGGQPSQAADH